MDPQQPDPPGGGISLANFISGPRDQSNHARIMCNVMEPGTNKPCGWMARGSLKHFTQNPQLWDSLKHPHRWTEEAQHNKSTQQQQARSAREEARRANSARLMASLDPTIDPEQAARNIQKKVLKAAAHYGGTYGHSISSLTSPELLDVIQTVQSSTLDLVQASFNRNPKKKPSEVLSECATKMTIDPFTRRAMRAAIIDDANDRAQAVVNQISENGYCSSTVDAGTKFDHSLLQFNIHQKDDEQFLNLPIATHVMEGSTEADYTAAFETVLKSNTFKDLKISTCTTDGFRAQVNNISMYHGATFLSNLDPDDPLRKIVHFTCVDHKLHNVYCKLFKNNKWVSATALAVQEMSRQLRSRAGHQTLGKKCPLPVQTRWIYTAVTLLFILRHQQEIVQFLKCSIPPEFLMLMKLLQPLLVASDRFAKDAAEINDVFPTLFEVDAYLKKLQTDTSLSRDAINACHELRAIFHEKVLDCPTADLWALVAVLCPRGFVDVHKIYQKPAQVPSQFLELIPARVPLETVLEHFELEEVPGNFRPFPIAKEVTTPNRDAVAPLVQRTIVSFFVAPPERAQPVQPNIPPQVRPQQNQRPRGVLNFPPAANQPNAQAAPPRQTATGDGAPPTQEDVANLAIPSEMRQQVFDKEMDPDGIEAVIEEDPPNSDAIVNDPAEANADIHENDDLIGVGTHFQSHLSAEEFWKYNIKRMARRGLRSVLKWWGYSTQAINAIDAHFTTWMTLPARQLYRSSDLNQLVQPSSFLSSVYLSGQNVSTTFNLLQDVANRLSIARPTEASVERVFSIVRTILDIRRARMLPDLLWAQIVLVNLRDPAWEAFIKQPLKV